MKILVLSRSAWDDSDSFGNTFSNLFTGMEGIDVYNICCQDGAFNNAVVKGAYQMTDKKVLRSTFGGKAGQIISDLNIDATQAPHVRFKYKRRTIYFIIRDFIWFIGRWFDKDLKSFLDNVSPDLIYIPVYSSWYMCNVQNAIVDYCNVPCVAHITDDNYNYLPHMWKEPINLFYRYILRRKIRNLIRKVTYIDVFAKSMALEYNKYFSKPCYIIGKGIDMKLWIARPKFEKPDNPYLFVYTGNIGSERYLQLAKLGKQLERLLPGSRLMIYSQTYFDKNIQEAFNGIGSIQFCGSITSSEVKEVQSSADFLVHVEGFSEQSIFETRMSFSTKLIDYMMANRVILAIGPSDVCSINILQENRMAITATDECEIKTMVENIKDNSINYDELMKNVDVYVRNDRDIKVIQNAMMQRFKNLVTTNNKA